VPQADHEAEKKQGNSAMKSAEEWLPFNLCSKKLAAVTKNLEVAICSALP
jgi:hypothetical protein